MLDLDGKLSKDGKLLYRLNLSAQNKKSHRDYEYNNRYAMAPVLSYQINDNTKITAEYTYQYAKMTDVGSYYVFAPGTEYATLPRNFTMTAPGLEPTKITDQTFLINFEHQISNDWKLTAQAMHSKYRHQGTSSWPSIVNPDGTLQRGISIWDAASDITMGQLFINGNVRTGKITHRILGGIDAGSKDYMADWGQYFVIDSANGGEFNPADPNYGVPSNGFPIWDRTTPLEARSVQAGGLMGQRYAAVYVQDELGFFENKLRLTLAGRYTDLSQHSWGDPAVKAKKLRHVLV
ncbi:TonB-dependent siderophore receptor [Niabella ginsengisoli]|uniref:TonB-dependent receptor n=1 Tax=Niabella ginsengisoli TaxID=522298 RepID=A0ABS9SJN0_9BACT|nr:hypothetical protein [Niabella ginsengisoli]MCH5598569.1 hypothetical protein [Niabella ginsengisoli]